MALREIIINAIEHGNLNISYEEKTRAIITDKYFEILAERQNDPKYKNRRVKILYKVDPEKVYFLITDMGEGFDYQKILMDSSKKANEESLQHGRGISMTKRIFDEIRFNPKGNRVILLKKFR